MKNIIICIILLLSYSKNKEKKNIKWVRGIAVRQFKLPKVKKIKSIPTKKRNNKSKLCMMKANNQKVWERKKNYLTSMDQLVLLIPKQ
jgi:hypothetical protein